MCKIFEAFKITIDIIITAWCFPPFAHFPCLCFPPFLRAMLRIYDIDTNKYFCTALCACFWVSWSKKDSLSMHALRSSYICFAFSSSANGSYLLILHRIMCLFLGVLVEKIQLIHVCVEIFIHLFCFLFFCKW